VPWIVLTGPFTAGWLDTTNHIDLFDQPKYVLPAVVATAHWMNRHLAGNE
jgi:hypothetical protein